MHPSDRIVSTTIHTANGVRALFRRCLVWALRPVIDIVKEEVAASLKADADKRGASAAIAIRNTVSASLEAFAKQPRTFHSQTRGI